MNIFIKKKKVENSPLLYTKRLMPGLRLQQYQEKPSTPENMVGLIKYSSVIIKYIQNSNLVYAHYQYNNLFFYP